MTEDVAPVETGLPAGQLQRCLWWSDLLDFKVLA